MFRSEKNDAIRKIIGFNGNPEMIITFDKFMEILNIAGINWFGFNNWSRGDIDRIDEISDIWVNLKFDHENAKKTRTGKVRKSEFDNVDLWSIKVHDSTFDWENFEK